MQVYRIGDRNLIDTVLGSDFQRTLSSYELSDLADERGVKVWTGDSTTRMTLNADVTTAFPVDQALGDLQPGVYVMTAAAERPAQAATTIPSTIATQWFIVSDLGLTAFSGNDGVHVFVNSLASTEPDGRGRGPADRAQQRSARHREDRRRRPRAVRGRIVARRGRAVAGDADRHRRARATTPSSV